MTEKSGRRRSSDIVLYSEVITSLESTDAPVHKSTTNEEREDKKNAHVNLIVGTHYYAYSRRTGLVIPAPDCRTTSPQKGYLTPATLNDPTTMKGRAVSTTLSRDPGIAREKRKRRRPTFRNKTPEVCQ